jgi:hypothetical protein
MERNLSTRSGDIKLTIEGVEGPPGLSAYEVAVENGFVGTEAEWLASLGGTAGGGVSSHAELTGLATSGHPASAITGLHAVATSGDYTALTNKPSLGGAAALEVGTAANTVAAGNDARLSDARTPTTHTHPSGDITGLHAVATSGDYTALANQPTARLLPAGGASGQVLAKSSATDYAVTWATPAGGGSGPATVKLTADHAPFTLTALTNITGLSFAVTSGTLYRFSFWLVFRTPALTTGARFGLTHPGATVFAGSTRILFAGDGSDSVFEGALTTSGDSVMSTAVPATNTDYIAVIEGILLPSANGTLQVQAATEVAASALTVRNGSHGQLWTVT